MSNLHLPAGTSPEHQTPCLCGHPRLWHVQYVGPCSTSVDGEHCMCRTFMPAKETREEWEARIATGRDTAPAGPFDADRIETHARVQTVVSLVERCHEELTRLELIPSGDADDVNALSAAKGFLARARTTLRGRFS